MTTALLYESGPSWRLWIAFGAAAAVHFAAIALARIHPTEPMDAGIIATEFSIIEAELPAPPEEATLPPVLEPPHIPPEETLFPDERPTPPPVRQQTHKAVRRIVRAAVQPGSNSMTMSSAKAEAIYAPKPQYPYEARRQRITGDGVVAMNVNPVTGSVTDVAMLKSTGSAVLDNATINGFRRWRFKPGSVLRVKAPITYTLAGASY